MLTQNLNYQVRGQLKLMSQGQDIRSMTDWQQVWTQPEFELDMSPLLPKAGLVRLKLSPSLFSMFIHCVCHCRWFNLLPPIPIHSIIMTVKIGPNDPYIHIEVIGLLLVGLIPFKFQIFLSIPAWLCGMRLSNIQLGCKRKV